jgi:hypothetical protein
MARTWVLALVLVLATASAACGSGGGTSASSTTTTSTSSTSTTAPTSTACSTPTTVAGSNSGPEANPPGDIPDHQVFVAYSPPSGTYSVKVPEGWARSESTNEVTFTDKLNRIHVALTSTATAPTVESVKRDEVPKLAASEPCFVLKDVTSVTRTAGAVVLVTYTAKSAPDPVTGKVIPLDVERYELWSGGTTATLTLSGPAGSDNVDPWRTVTDSFAWKR